MLNVYEQVSQNKRRSIFVILIFSGFIISFVWFLVNYLQSDPDIIIFAIIFSLFSSFSSYFWGDKIVLSLARAKPAKREEYFDFYTIAENLAIASQLPKPKLYVINSSHMNAFATGRDPEHAVICATTGLLEKLNRTELENVIAHEMSHIQNYDIRLMTIVAILVGMISMVSHILTRGQRFGKSRQRRENEKSNPIFMILGLIAIIISPIIAKLIQLAISRRREFLADASAVKLTRQPQGLIDALKKLDQNQVPLKTANPAMAHLYITNPFKIADQKASKFASLFSTHPPVSQRITELQKML